MKQIYLLIVAVFFIGCAGANLTTNQPSKPLQKTYAASLPCADCEGIRHIVFFDQDFKFRSLSIFTKSNQNSELSNGKYSINGDIITLSEDDGQISRYKMAKSNLIRLDANGNMPSGEFGQMYVYSEYKPDIDGLYCKTGNSKFCLQISKNIAKFYLSKNDKKSLCKRIGLKDENFIKKSSTFSIYEYDKKRIFLDSKAKICGKKIAGFYEK